jgi:hypothetical protein
MSSSPIKKTRTASAWLLALKEHNTGKQWLVPKKGTPEYDQVKKIADRIKLELIQQYAPRPTTSAPVEVVPIEDLVKPQTPPVKKPRRKRAKSVPQTTDEINTQ